MNQPASEMRFKSSQIRPIQSKHSLCSVHQWWLRAYSFVLFVFPRTGDSLIRLGIRHVGLILIDHITVEVNSMMNGFLSSISSSVLKCTSLLAVVPFAFNESSSYTPCINQPNVE